MSTDMLHTTTVDQALYHAATRATLAPSIHNTQPWRFAVRSSRMDVFADPDRRVPVIDPSGRQTAISCGAALFGVRASLAGASLEAVTTLVPEPAQPDLLATIRIIGRTSVPDPDARRLDDAADRRHSNRRAFTSSSIPETLVDVLTHAAEVEGAWLQPIRSEQDRVLVAVLSQRADAMQTADLAYRVELRAWTTDDPARLDGVPGGVIPKSDGTSQDDIPIRDFDTKSVGELPADTHSTLNQTLFVLGTSGDGLRDWLVAGQALERVLLELTAAGCVVSIMSQIAEQPSTRQSLRLGLRLSGEPHLLLRVGFADPTPATPRRSLGDVVTTDFPIAGVDLT